MSENRKRTYGEVLEGLRAVVATKPADYVYRPTPGNGKCNYWDRKKDCPSCLIGVYLHSIGYKADLLAKMDDLEDPAWSDNPLYLNGGFTDKANDLMKAVQHHQDSGKTWVEALHQGQQSVTDPNHYAWVARYNDNEEHI